MPLNKDLEFAVPHDRNDTTIIIFYDVILFLGLISLLAILLTAIFSKKVCRSATWYSFTSSWVVYCGAFLVLLGNQESDEVPRALCVFQTSLIYAVTILTALSILALLIQLYQSLVSSIYRETPGKYWVYALVFTPWWIASIMVAVGISHAISNPNFVSRQDTGMYCHFSDDLLVKITTYFLVIDTVGTFVSIGLIISLVYKNWRVVQNVQSLPMIIRITIFSLLPLIPLILNIIVMNTHNMFIDNLSNILAATLPLGAGIIFATPPDVLTVWRLRRISEKDSASSQTDSTATA